MIATRTTTRPVLTSERLTLRPMVIGDVTDTYVRWLNDPTVNRYSEYRFTTHTLSTVHAYFERACADEQTHFFAIMTRDDGCHIGNAKLGPVETNHRRASFGIMIGERDAWGKGYATEALAILERYAFDVLGIHKLTAGAVAENVGSVRMLEKCGFVVEGRRRAHFRDADQFLDVIEFGKCAGD